MQLSDITLTSDQRDQILAAEVDRRVRKGATLLAVEDNTALVRFGPEQGIFDLAYLLALWGFNTLFVLCTFGVWLIPLAVIWGLFHKVWRKAEGIKVHDTGQVEVHTYGKTLAYLAERNLRTQQA